MEYQDSSKKQRGTGGIFAVRYILCALLFLSCFLVYAMRINLSVSIVAMVNSSTPENVPPGDESCRDGNAIINGTTPSEFEGGEFNWDAKQQAMITYAFFVGYLLSQIPGGYLAERYSVSWVLALGVGLTSLFTCLTSVAARTNFYVFVVLRVLEGLSEGVMYPAVYAFVSFWIPMEEQSFLLNLVLSGSVVGTVVTMPVSAMLCKSVLGWPASFYIFGVIGLVWTFVWLAVAADGPECHRWISKEEHDYILETRPPSTKDQSKSVPWKRMLLSPPVLLLGLTKLGSTLNFYMILTELPNYLNSMYGVNIVDNGFINGGMNLGLAISIVGTGLLVDKLIVNEILSRNFTRKLFVAFSTLIPSLCLCIISLIGCNYNGVLVLLLVNCIFLGCMGGGDTAISLDLAPKYAGTLQGVVNLMGNFAGVLAPQLVGVMTENNNTLNQWNLVFICTAIFTAVCSTIFLIFGTTKEQNWDSPNSDEDGLVVVQ